MRLRNGGQRGEIVVGRVVVILISSVAIHSFWINLLTILYKFKLTKLFKVFCFVFLFIFVFCLFDLFPKLKTLL